MLMWLRLAKEEFSDELAQQGLGWLCSGMAVISLKTSPSGPAVLQHVPDSDPKKLQAMCGLACSSQAGGS